MDDKKFKEIFILILIGLLLVLSFLIIKPVLISMIFGLLSAYVCYPIHKRLVSKIKSKNLSALIICFAILAIILVPVWLLTPLVLKQVFDIYAYSQKIDLVSIFNSVFPAFSSQEISVNVISSMNSFISEITSYLLRKFTDVLLNLPSIIFQLFIVIFTFFFALRDGRELVDYIKSLSPLSKESEKKFFEKFGDITYSVIIGQIIVGIVQGVVTGIGFLIFGIENALILTLVSILVGILPIIGSWLVWIPVDVYLFATGRTGPAIGLLIYGLIIISWVDTLIRPLVMSKRTKINSGILLIGMIGGLYVFGVLGLVLGPLILAYLLIVLELYRQRTYSNIFFKPVDEKG